MHLCTLQPLDLYLQMQSRTARAKSNVVAQAFTQTFGVDYDKTYAPVS